MQLSNISTTKMTSKGQVVIPEEIRDFLHLESGTRFVVIAAEGDSVILKKIRPLAQKDIKALLKVSQKIAEDCGFTPDDVEQEIKKYRKSKKDKN